MTKEISLFGNNCLSLTFSSPTNKITITANKNIVFSTLAEQICKLENLHELRFLLDGTRVQNHLTLAENGLQDKDVIEIVQEMYGGKGPNNENILEMLENCKSESEDSEEDSDAYQLEKSKEEAERTDQNIPRDLNSSKIDSLWFEKLKQEFKEGKLKLNKAKPMDEKLLFHLESDNLQQDELLRLRNIYSIWEQHNKWDLVDKREVLLQPVESGGLQEESCQQQEPLDMSTPSKRQKLMERFDMKTPSPLRKKSHVNEEAMKQISVGVHLWAERKRGGTKYLQDSRLLDSDFKDILSFAGPESD